MTTPWITILIDKLQDAKAAAMVDQLRTAALGAGQVDPVPDVIIDVTNRIRQEIAGGGKTVLSADATKIPPSLRRLAMRMIIREAQSRLNVMGALPLSDDERKEWDKDDRYLERIADGLAVEAPDDPQVSPTVQPRVGTPRITPRVRDTQDHL